MEVIQSFTIDHTHLKPGIYISREDKGFTTFDEIYELMVMYSYIY